MQPPPRKGNYVKFLRNLHAEQVAKLQLKNQHECDLLEDIRQFTVKRSAIEKTYSEALLKISSQYLNKKIPNIPDIKMEGMEERWNMWSVWRTVLEENEKLARARLAAIEVFQQQIADEAKVLRDYKVGIAKKSLAQISNVQKELHLSVGDLDKMKKQYFDEEHCAHDVRDKARDIEEKLKKKKGSFFQSITSLQKNSARVTSRKELLEEKSTGARNDYILSLAATNAHQNRYFTVDLQTTMTTMENYVFERVAEYLTLMGRTELLTCSATQNSFGKIRDQAQQLTREYNLQCCYLFYPVLKQHIQYEFEPCDNDPVRKVTTEHESAVETLTKEARNLASRVVKENVSVRENAKKLAICVALRDSGQRTDPNDPNGPDLDTKIEELRDMIRRSETEKVKAEACLQCLREGGINVDEWVQEAEIIGAQELTRSASSISMRTDASGQGENPSSDSFYDSDKEDTGTIDTQAVTGKLQEEHQLTHDKTFSDSEEEEPAVDDAQAASAPSVSMMMPMTAATGWDDPTKVNWGEEEEQAEVERDEVSVASEFKEVIFKCTALYSYSAQNPDELTIVENEQLEVIGEGDGDGWLRARNYRGEVGYVPHNYLDIEQDTNINGTSANILRSQISFSSVDYTVDNEDQTGDSMQSPDQVSVIMAPATATTTATTIIGNGIAITGDTTAGALQKKSQPSDVQYCIAMYDYDATAEDELTFEEGQIIKIITKTAHGVDDGWWEGELDGKFGNFPSLVVEECDENGEPFSEGEDISLPTSTLPSIALPPVPTLPPEYAHEINDDMFGSQDTVDDDSGYIPNSSAQNVPAPVLTQEAGQENQGESTEDIVSEQKSLIAATHPALNITKSESNKRQDLGDTLHLGMAQIVVTAATPMVEDGKGKSFPLTDDTHNSKEDEKPTSKKQIEQVVPKASKGGKKGDEMRTIQTKVTTTESQNNHVQGRQENEVCVIVTLTSASPKSDDTKHSPILSEQANDIADVQPLEEAEDPFNEKKSSEINSNETNDAPFEANFEDAFAETGFTNNNAENVTENDAAEDEATPKQVVGGRASIPEELDSNQLARLQNLKESNA